MVENTGQCWCRAGKTDLALEFLLLLGWEALSNFLKIALAAVLTVTMEREQKQGGQTAGYHWNSMDSVYHKDTFKDNIN